VASTTAGQVQSREMRQQQKITLGEMRQSAVTGLLVYCSDDRCSRHIRITADGWPDEVRLSDLEPRFIL
jgi:hypothetical protein